MSERCVLCRVEGRVQGVFFRATTQEQARALGLRGYVRNLPDGSVEVYACGEDGALEALRAWLWEGPPYARVVQVRCEEASPRAVTGFQVR
jgi:acylphosphatase